MPRREPLRQTDLAHAIDRIGVLGGGAWGTALAQAAARAGRRTVLWARDPAVVAELNAARTNARRLPGVELEPGVRATGDLGEAVRAADALLLAVPAQQVRALCRALPAAARAPLVVCAKGFESASGALLGEVVAAERPGQPFAALSGPSFAGEVARGLPTAVTIGCRDAALGRALVEALGSRSFRCYWTDDAVGVQVGGAVKNVLAIAAGVVMGRGLGENARAAVVARGLAELSRLGEAMGARAETLMGLSGLGDLVLTCTSLTSRNTSFGYALGRGKDVRGAALGGAGRRPLAEGVFTAEAVARLAARFGVEVPICAAVHAILHEGADIDAAIEGLLARPFRTDPVG